MDDLVINSRLKISGDELSWTAVRSQGPGGQNVNKVSTRVELRFFLSKNTTIPTGARARLKTIAGSRLDSSGTIILSSQATRSQRRNLEEACERLAEMIRQALVRPKVRRATKPSRGAKRRRLDAKKRTGDKKKMRGKVDYD